MSSNDDSNNTGRPRRGSFTTQTFTNLFGTRNNSNAGTPAFPGPISTAAADQQRRRMSMTGVGLSGTSPTSQTALGFNRRSSVSTAGSDSIDESAIEDDDGGGRSNSTTPFSRRMSFGAQALRTVRGNGSPGNGRSSQYTVYPNLHPDTARGSGGGRPPPNQISHLQASTQSMPRTTSDNTSSSRPGEGSGFNWSEQLRSRAESSVSQAQRPLFSASVSPSNKSGEMNHERARSVSDMQTPPAAIPPPAAPAPVKRQRPVPDAIGERMLKGDFYMD